MTLHRSLKLTDLHRKHPVVQAAHMMVEAHRLHETMVAALDDVQAEFPELEPEQIILLWIGGHISRQCRSSFGRSLV